MRKSMIGMAMGILPWVGSGIASGALGHGTAALVGVGLSAAALLRTRIARERPKLLELAAIAYFSFYLIESGWLGGGFFAAHGPWLMHVVLAAVAFGSILADTPFTLQYAREDWPAAYWQTAGFRKTNTAISFVWGVVFALGAAVAAFQSTHALASAAAGATVGLGAVFTVWFQRLLPRRYAARMLAAREDYQWPAPSLGAPANDPTRHDAIVVGAGIGGLTAAALLARAGRKVLVVEAHDRVGGYCSSWVRKTKVDGRILRFIFDAGVHDVSGLAPGAPLAEILRRAGVADRLDWRRMGQRYHCGGRVIDIPEGEGAFAAEMTRLFPNQSQGIRDFLDVIEKVGDALRAITVDGVPRPPQTVAAMLAFPRKHPTAFVWMNRPYRELLETYVPDPEARRVLAMLCPYLSDAMDDLTVAAMAPLFSYLGGGGHYPAGGSMRLAEVLADVVRETGGRVMLRSPVRCILHEDGAVTGILTGSGEVHHAPLVVANSDLRRTLLELVGTEHLPPAYLERATGLEAATSAFMVTLGVDMVPEVPPIIMVDNPDFGLGIAIPSLVDPSLASEGHSAVTLMALIPGVASGGWDRSAPDYEARKGAIGDRLIAAAEEALPGLSRHIVYREDASPATFGRYALTSDGSVYGFRRRGWVPPTRTPIRGLCLAGAGTFPGSGVEAVAISGALAAEAAMGG